MLAEFPRVYYYVLKSWIWFNNIRLLIVFKPLDLSLHICFISYGCNLTGHRRYVVTTNDTEYTIALKN